MYIAKCEQNYKISENLPSQRNIFNTLLSLICKTSRSEISKDMEYLSNILRK